MHLCCLGNSIIDEWIAVSISSSLYSVLSQGCPIRGSNHSYLDDCLLLLSGTSISCSLRALGLAYFYLAIFLVPACRRTQLWKMLQELFISGLINNGLDLGRSCKYRVRLTSLVSSRLFFSTVSLLRVQQAFFLLLILTGVLLVEVARGCSPNWDSSLTFISPLYNLSHLVFYLPLPTVPYIILPYE
jgi:hypothetical protein